MLTVGDDRIGGIVALDTEELQAGASPHGLAYIAAEKVDDVAQRARALGGKVLLPGTEIPEIGRYAVLADPQGAIFALFESHREAAPPDNLALGHFGWSELNTTDWEAAQKF